MKPMDAPITDDELIDNQINSIFDTEEKPFDESAAVDKYYNKLEEQGERDNDD